MDKFGYRSFTTSTALGTASGECPMEYTGADKMDTAHSLSRLPRTRRLARVWSEPPWWISLDTGCFQPEEPGFGPAVTFAPGRDWPPPSQALCG